MPNKIKQQQQQNKKQESIYGCESVTGQNSSSRLQTLNDKTENYEFNNLSTIHNHKQQLFMDLRFNDLSQLEEYRKINNELNSLINKK